VSDNLFNLEQINLIRNKIFGVPMNIFVFTCIYLPFALALTCPY